MFMKSLGLLVPNYKRLELSHSLLWESFGVPRFRVHRISNEMDFVLANRYLDRHAYYGMRRKVTEGKLRNCYFCENPIRPHVNFGPQNDPLRAIQPK